MTERTPKTKRPVHVTLSVRDEKNPDAKPSLSDAQARRFLAAIEAGDWMGQVREEEECTSANCRAKVEGVKELYSFLGGGGTLSCSYSCSLFFSTGGGWEYVCYFHCQGPGITIEGTLG